MSTMDQSDRPTNQLRTSKAVPAVLLAVTLSLFTVAFLGTGMLDWVFRALGVKHIWWVDMSPNLKADQLHFLMIYWSALCVLACVILVTTVVLYKRRPIAVVVANVLAWSLMLAGSAWQDGLLQAFLRW